jgi:hypothetical protein
MPEQLALDRTNGYRIGIVGILWLATHAYNQACLQSIFIYFAISRRVHKRSDYGLMKRLSSNLQRKTVIYRQLDPRAFDGARPLATEPGHSAQYSHIASSSVS